MFLKNTKCVYSLIFYCQHVVSDIAFIKPNILLSWQPNLTCTTLTASSLFFPFGMFHETRNVTCTYFDLQ